MADGPPSTLNPEVRLPATAVRLLDEGDRTGKYEDKAHKLLAAVVFACEAAGMSADETCQLVQASAGIGGRRLHLKFGALLGKRVRSQHRMAGERRAEWRQKTAQLFATVEHARRPLGLSAAHLAVYGALLGIAVRTGSLEFTASNRQLAEAANVGSVGRGRDWSSANSTTVSRAIARLASQGLVERTKRGRGTQASTLKLADLDAVRSLVESHNDMHSERANNPTPWGSTWVSGTKTVHVRTGMPSSHPLWSRGGGLGPSAEAVWRHVQATPDGTTVAALSAALGGMHRNSISKQLAKLEEHGLVRRERLGRTDVWSVGHRSPDDVADAVGAWDRADRQREAHRQQRSAYVAGRRNAAARRRQDSTTANSMAVDTDTGEILDEAAAERTICTAA